MDIWVKYNIQNLCRLFVFTFPLPANRSILIVPVELAMIALAGWK